MSGSVPLVHSTAATTAMRAAPIDPSWIVEGDPQARVSSLSRSADGRAWTDLWDCTAGRFRWHYALDETIHVLEGEATVIDQTGRVWSLTPGDTVTFHHGTVAHWHVANYVRKVAFCHHPAPPPVAAFLHVTRTRIGRLAMGSLAAAVAMLSTVGISELV